MPTQSVSRHRQPPPQLVTEVAAQSSRVVPHDFTRLAEALHGRYGESLDAVILYGSCLHAQNPAEGVVDLYAVVTDYRSVYSKRHLRWFNAWLPPNVFYLEIEGSDSPLRCKYAVISRADFDRGCRYWFHSYIWARFAQPVRLLYARDDDARNAINESLAAAVVSFLETTLPMLGNCDADPEEIWARGLSLTYAAELRPEPRGQARRLTHLNMGDYGRLTAAVAEALPQRLRYLDNGTFRCISDRGLQRRARWKWRLRRIQGRILSVLRLMKAVFTFNHCVEYAVWKIKRHTGVNIEITPRLQRHPILWGSSILWQLLRRGILR